MVWKRMLAGARNLPSPAVRSSRQLPFFHHGADTHARLRIVDRGGNVCLVQSLRFLSSPIHTRVPGRRADRKRPNQKRVPPTDRRGLPTASQPPSLVPLSTTLPHPLLPAD